MPADTAWRIEMVYTPYIWLLVLSALVNGWLAWRMRRYQDVPSARSFQALMGIAAAWALLYGIGVSVVNVPLKIFIVHLTYIPSLLSTIASLSLALEYTGHEKWLTPRRFALLLVLPVLFLILAFTSQSHHLWRYDYRLYWSSGVPVIVATKGAMYWVYVVYMTTLALSAYLTLVTSFRRSAPYFRNTLILTAGMLVPFVTGLLYVFGLTPVRGFDWIPSSFIWTGFLYVWAVLRGRLFDVVPVARNLLVDNLEDLMIAVNIEDVVMDCNRAAESAMGASSSIIGVSTAALPPHWAEIFRRYANLESCKNEVVIGSQTYEMLISPMRRERGQERAIGRVFLFHDITHLKRVEAEERNLRILAEALQTTAQALNSALAHEDILQKILENVGRVAPIDSANIALLDESGVLRYVRFYGYMENKVSEEELNSFSSANSPIFKRIFETGEPVIIPDTHADPDWVIVPSGAWIRSYAAMPIRVRDQTIGVLNLDSATIGFYTPEHIHSLRAFADQVAVAVQNSHLFQLASRQIAERKQAEERAKKQNDYLSALHQIAIELLDHPYPASLLTIIAERAADLINAQHGFMFFPEGDQLALRAATKGFARHIGRREPIPGTGVLGRVWQSGKPFAVENYTAWELHDPSYQDEQLASVAGAPIKVRERMVGVLEVANTDQTRLFSADEIEILERFAALASLVIDKAQLVSNLQTELEERKQAQARLLEANARLETQMEQIQGLQIILREQSIRDPLTGLYNRRYLAETQERELARAEREGYPVSFAMIDIDRFKSVNDTFGHEIGDQVLKHLASLVVANARAGDIICRYGGEEILAILPNVSAKTAFEITDRWRIAFMELALPPEMGYIKSTISCGIAAYPAHAVTASELISLADKAMYQAKAAGRNQVVVWQPPRKIARRRKKPL